MGASWQAVGHVTHENRGDDALSRLYMWYFCRDDIMVQARIFMDELEMSQQHAECSCVQGESGRCPRGARYRIASVPPETPDYCEADVQAPTEANGEKVVVPEQLLSQLQNCNGSIQVTTTASFTIEAPEASVRCARVDRTAGREVIPHRGVSWAFHGFSCFLPASLGRSHTAHARSGVLLVALLVRVGFSAPIQWSDRFLRLDTYEVEEVTLPQKAGAKLIFDGQNLRCRLERSRTPVHIAYKPFLWY